MANAVRQYIPQSKVNYHTGSFQMLRLARIRDAFTKSKRILFFFSRPATAMLPPENKNTWKNPPGLSLAENPERVLIITPQN